MRLIKTPFLGYTCIPTTMEQTDKLDERRIATESGSQNGELQQNILNIHEFLNLDIEDEDLDYHSDEGYQHVFLRFFRIEEEEDFDDDTIYEGLAAILGKSQGNELLINLYAKAAGQFLSEEPDVGLPVLLSYTYFAAFYQLFVYYLAEGATPEWEDKVREMTAMFSGSSA